jgi:hypothetical protein
LLFQPHTTSLPDPSHLCQVGETVCW